MFDIVWVDSWDEKQENPFGWGRCLKGGLTAVEALEQLKIRRPVALLDYGGGEVVVLDVAAMRRGRKKVRVTEADLKRLATKKPTKKPRKSRVACAA